MQPDTTDDKSHLIDNVRTFDHEQREHAQNIKTLREQMQEVAESLPEHAAVESLKAQLKAAQDTLKFKLLRTPRYNELADRLADEKHQKLEAETDLSDFLLAYHAETKERQIELEPKDAREVILKAKLGKSREFQTSLLTQGGEE